MQRLLLHAWIYARLSALLDKTVCFKMYICKDCEQGKTVLEQLKAFIKTFSAIHRPDIFPDDLKLHKVDWQT